MTSIRWIRGNRGHIPRYKREAQRFAEEKCALYARHYGVRYAKITIRAQKRRWGSCSRAGNLSFNYKIALLPPRIAEYVIVHEICHLLRFDHSPRFWAEVEKTIPDHRALRRELRSLGFTFRRAPRGIVASPVGAV